MTTIPMVYLTPEEVTAAMESFVKIVQFPTVSNTSPSNGEYKKCAAYIKDQLSSIHCLDEIHYLEEAPDHSPVVVARWKGKDENLGILLLNSHYDVVPAKKEEWTVDPFAGLQKDGRVYGRGTQDMKCVCIQYIEAIRKLSLTSFTPERSIYLTFLPDEEVGGMGMTAFLSSKLYQNLPSGIALALDEGLASTDDTYSVFYGERLPWWVDVTATGNTGHGSRFIEPTAIEQISKVVQKALEFRQGQKAALHGSMEEADHSNCAHAVASKRRRAEKESKGTKMAMGDVTSLNVTTLQAGVKAGDSYVYNCVPPVAKCSLDIRISPHVEPSKIKDMLDGWCKECSASEEDGHKVTWNHVLNSGSSMKHALTSRDAEVNPWYGVFGSALEEIGIKFTPEVFPAATDSRFLRLLGVRALGFSPMRNSEIMLHENDEYLDEEVFLEGIRVYVHLIEALGSQGSDIDLKKVKLARTE
mmetsp:Transcript_24497/g.28886  ORF Transcript_24497/g.28886 Transcript_24497/m.28886 type:complete len:471 (-) Transcript_24497:136-1548(-)|eukprot:CAMPEP_0198269464 /NCGR_PEP_ID=MMETSP1447-20131203/41380_1 /TAXON_ID=420782 /ORGANISM="Chaetoceros dichaeta, Strain CCMP1751" /LENGTH=470 /DNA_ID=CAMNT_0043961059 /DNA_START=17 /DNA_END=1429 /DNA_ORIENTATION=+